MYENLKNIGVIMHPCHNLSLSKFGGDDNDGIEIRNVILLNLCINHPGAEYGIFLANALNTMA